ncbi:MULTISPECIES: thioesterase II family protein [unclassified Streptomyces]|uniref:thioesterase II family protein n=1 Tax=unclassified Streptomyces TaxID=2593676 RepID=UPI00136EC8BE|nr:MULTISPECIES: alpha/beta fold hydrolase [unclassified Streptomyces]MCW5249033.1 alpha/beta fold hydrolase [Streptomyces sp. SHP 1-2]MYU21283.1 alpha/beta fold hydrolase [Streptomyces sp. SID8352]
MRSGPERVVVKRGGERRLVCVPFAGGSARSFTRLAHQLGDEWTVVAVQPPAGFGGTGASLDALAHFYLGLLAEDLRGPGLVLGHSLGAAAVQRMARIKGERWPDGLHVVLSAPPESGTTSADLLALDDSGLLEEAARRGMTPDLDVTEEFAKRFLLPDLRSDLAALRTRAWRPEPVHAPVHLLGGTGDAICPPARLESLGELLRPVSSRTVEGGHLYVVEEPSRTAEAVRAIGAAAAEGASALR